MLEPLRTAETVIIECKQSRADFLRDSRCLNPLLEERARLNAVRIELEERIIKASEPHLMRTGAMLFPELETWDFGSSTLPSYRGVLRELRRLDVQIHGQTKFWTIARYTLADLLLVAAPAGMVDPRELPPGWGLLEVPAGLLKSLDGVSLGAGVRLSVAPARRATAKRREQLLRNIAVAATREAWRGRLPSIYADRDAAQAPADSPTA